MVRHRVSGIYTLVYGMSHILDGIQLTQRGNRGCSSNVEWQYFLGRINLVIWPKTLRGCKKMVFGNQDNRLLEIQNGTKELEDEGESRELTITERSKLINSLVTERNVEAIWRQKSRQNRCKLGDRNTRFFHLAAGMRRSRNSTISKIIYGTMHHNHLSIRHKGCCSILSLQSSFHQTKSSKGCMGVMGFKGISPQLSTWLEQDATLEEVKQAVWDCDVSKAPCPDGFTLSFYRKAWHLLGIEILSMELLPIIFLNLY